MTKFLSILLMFLTVVPHSIEEEHFITNVHECYDKYIYAVDKEIEFGDVVVAFGIHKDKYYVSAFLLSESSISPTIYIYINDKMHTCVAEGTIASAYGFKVNSDDTLKIVFGKDIQNQTYELNVQELIDKLNQEPITGNGTGDFPQNKRESFLMSMIKYLLIGFGIFAVVLIVILVIIVKKGNSIFGRKVYYTENDYTNYDNNQGFEDKQVIDTTYEEVQEKDRQALMDKYFEEFRSGDITEEELNEKLKKLWWKND